MPRTAVIIPVHNAVSTIRSAVDSALAQSSKDLEVVVVDDASTDRSLDQLPNDRRLKVVELKQNEGGAAARNHGLSASDSTYVQFLDADDLLSADKIENAIQAFAEVSQSATTIVFCDAQVQNGRSSEAAGTHHRSDWSPTVDPLQFVLNGALPTPCPLHQRTHLVAVGGFTAGLPCAQERDLHLRLAASGMRFVYTRTNDVVIRRFPGSVSSNELRVLQQHLPIARRVEDLLRASGDTSGLEQLAGWILRDSRRLRRLGEHENAAQYFDAAYSLHPAGGLHLAYSRPASALLRVSGPRSTESVLSACQRARQTVLHRKQKRA